MFLQKDTIFLVKDTITNKLLSPYMKLIIYE